MKGEGGNEKVVHFTKNCTFHGSSLVSCDWKTCLSVSFDGREERCANSGSKIAGDSFASNGDTDSRQPNRIKHWGWNPIRLASQLLHTGICTTICLIVERDKKSTRSRGEGGSGSRDGERTPRFALGTYALCFRVREGVSRGRSSW